MSLDDQLGKKLNKLMMLNEARQNLVDKKLSVHVLGPSNDHTFLQNKTLSDEDLPSNINTEGQEINPFIYNQNKQDYKIINSKEDFLKSQRQELLKDSQQLQKIPKIVGFHNNDLIQKEDIFSPKDDDINIKFPQESAKVKQIINDQENIEVQSLKSKKYKFDISRNLNNHLSKTNSLPVYDQIKNQNLKDHIPSPTTAIINIAMSQELHDDQILETSIITDFDKFNLTNEILKLSKFQIPEISGKSPKSKNQKSIIAKKKSKFSFNCLSPKRILTKWNIEAKNIILNCETYGDFKYETIKEASFQKQVKNVLEIWKSAPPLMNFSLQIKTENQLGNDAIKLIKEMISSPKKLNENMCSEFRIISYCADFLYWSAPDFLFNHFIEYPLNSEKEDFKIKIEHIFTKYIDRGMTDNDFDKIISVFIEKYKLIKLKSLHVKVFSWLNFNNSSLTRVIKMLALYGSSIEDLQLAFSGKDIDDVGLNNILKEITYSVNNTILSSFYFGIESRTKFITNKSFINICETLLFLSENNDISRIGIYFISRELTDVSLEILNFTLNKIAKRITHLTLLFGTTKGITDHGLKFFLDDFFQNCINLENLTLGFLSHGIKKNGFMFLKSNIYQMKAPKIRTFNLYYNNHSQKSPHLEEEMKKDLQKFQKNIQNPNLNIYLSDKY